MSGLITAVGVGRATITATADAVVASAPVVVGARDDYLAGLRLRCR